MSNSGLKERMESFERRALCGGILVIAGLTIEVILALKTAFAIRFSHGEPFLESWGPVIADVFVALGVFAEIYFAQKARSISGELQRQSDEIVALANARTREAELKIAVLEKRVEPRIITDEEGAAITKKLIPFAWTKFSLRHDPAAEKTFIDKLIEVLQRANWTWQGFGHLLTLPLGDVGIDESALSGVQVRINGESTHLKEAADALVGALVKALGSSVSLAVDRPGSSPNACEKDKVHIEIYRK